MVQQVLQVFQVRVEVMMDAREPLECLEEPGSLEHRDYLDLPEREVPWATPELPDLQVSLVLRVPTE